MADEKPKDRASKLYDAGSKKKPSEDAMPAQEAAPVEAASSADKDIKPVEKASEKFLGALEKLRKLQEKERGDHHTAHREAIRTMGKRHDDAIKQLFDVMGGDDAMGEAAPMAESAAPAAEAAPMEA